MQGLRHQELQVCGLGSPDRQAVRQQIAQPSSRRPAHVPGADSSPSSGRCVDGRFAGSRCRATRGAQQTLLAPTGANAAKNVIHKRVRRHSRAADSNSYSKEMTREALASAPPSSALARFEAADCKAFAGYAFGYLCELTDTELDDSNRSHRRIREVPTKAQPLPVPRIVVGDQAGQIRGQRRRAQRAGRVVQAAIRRPAPRHRSRTYAWGDNSIWDATPCRYCRSAARISNRTRTRNHCGSRPLRSCGRLQTPGA